MVTARRSRSLVLCGREPSCIRRLSAGHFERKFKEYQGKQSVRLYRQRPQWRYQQRRNKWKGSDRNLETGKRISSLNTVQMSVCTLIDTPNEKKRLEQRQRQRPVGSNANEHLHEMTNIVEHRPRCHSHLHVRTGHRRRIHTEYQHLRTRRDHHPHSQTGRSPHIRDM